MIKRYAFLSLAVFCTLTLQRASGQQLVSATAMGTFTKEQIGTFLPIPGLARYDVNLYKVRYSTPDVKGVLDTASGLLAVPVLPNTTWPIMVYQHGTVESRDAVPSRMSGESTIGLIGAALGYVTVLPDYLGLGDARGFHPYVHAATEASAAVDMLRAVRQYASGNNLSLNGQLFITGYSQGGHAGMALHREIELNLGQEFQVTAAAHLSGPYSISSGMKALILSDEEYFFPGYALYTVLSYNLAYNLYDSLEQFIKTPYLEAAKAFYTGTEPRLDTVQARLTRLLRQEHGKVIPKLIFQDSLLDAIRNKPDHPVNLALLDNDVYRWAPKSPTRLFYCRADEQVAFTNSIIADSVMRALGAVDIAAADLNPTFNHGQCVQPALLSTIFFFGFYQSIATDVREGRAALPVRVYPNPARGWAYLEGVPQQSQISLWDLSGRLIRQYGQAQDAYPQLSLEGVQRGLYMLQVRSKEGFWAGKLYVE